MMSSIIVVRTPCFSRSPAARMVPGLVESYANRPESVTIATHSASALARSSGHSRHFANLHTISPALEAVGSMIEASANAPSLVTWWSMQTFGSFSATGRTSGGIRSNEPQSTATSRSKRRCRRSRRTGSRSPAPSRKSSLPSALTSAVATASWPACFSIRTMAIIEPSESPSGPRCPETRIRFAPSISFATARYVSLLSPTSSGLYQKAAELWYNNGQFPREE